MNREIKFRAFDKKNKCWFKTELIFYGFSVFGECTLVCPPSISRLKDIILSQYTGFKDKNGKCIYEGDLIKIYNNISTVTYERGAFGYNPDYNYFVSFAGHKHITYKKGCANEIEVVGNIYENKK